MKAVSMASLMAERTVRLRADSLVQLKVVQLVGKTVASMAHWMVDDLVAKTAVHWADRSAAL